MRWRAMVLGVVMTCIAALTPGHAHAAVIEELGYQCEGTLVHRCLWVNFDPDNNKIRAWSKVTDAAGERLVAVNRIRLQILAPNGSWSNIMGGPNTSWNDDFDGYWPVSEYGPGALWSCNGQSGYFRAYAHFEWIVDSTGSHGEDDAASRRVYNACGT